MEFHRRRAPVPQWGAKLHGRPLPPNEQAVLDTYPTVSTWEEQDISYDPDHDQERYDAFREQQFVPDILIDRLAGVRDLAHNRHGYRPYVLTKEQAEAESAYFPHLPALTLQAPFKPASSMSSRRSSAPIFKVLDITEIRCQIFRQLSHLALTNFAATCSTATAQVDQTFGWWNVAKNDFNNCDLSPAELQKTTADLALSDVLDSRRTVTMLMVSPSQPAYDHMSGRRERVEFLGDAQAVLRLMRSMYHVGTSIRHLKLIRVDLLTAPMVNTMLLQYLDKIETLEVISCPLISFTDTEELLLGVGAYQERRKRTIAFDFAPKFHRGSPWNDDYERVGRFGLTWSDRGVKFSPVVAQYLLADILPLMKKHDQLHMMEFDASFRNFLERLPLSNLLVPRVQAIFTMQYRTMDKPLRSAQIVRLHYAIALAVFGDGAVLERVADGQQSSDLQCNKATYSKWTKELMCQNCRRTFMALFFTVESRGLCGLCELQFAIEGEDDHYRWYRRLIARRLDLRRDDLSRDVYFVRDPGPIFEFDQQGYFDAHGRASQLGTLTRDFLRDARRLDRHAVKDCQNAMLNHAQERHELEFGFPQNMEMALKAIHYRKSPKWESLRADRDDERERKKLQEKLGRMDVMTKRDVSRMW